MMVSKEELTSIIERVQLASNSKGSISIYVSMCCALYTMGQALFGKLGNQYLWMYINNSEDNQFETIDELYDFLSDPNTIDLTNDPSPLNFDEKSKQPIIEDFKNFIKHI